MASTIYDIIIRAVDNAKSTLTGTGQQLDNLDKKTKQVNASFAGLGSTVNRFGQVGALAFAGLASKALQYADTIVDTADATDVAISTILGLKSVTEGTKVGLDDISTALLRFNENLGTAASSGGKELRKALGEVGVSLTDLANLPTDQLLQNVLAGLAGIEDKSKAAALAQDIFGKSLRGAPLDKFGSDLQRAISTQGEQEKATLEAAAAADALEAGFNKLIQTTLLIISPITQFFSSLDSKTVNALTTGIIALGVALTAVFAGTLIVTAIGLLGKLATALRLTALASATLQAFSGPVGLASLAAGAAAAAVGVYGINKLLDDTAEKQKKVGDGAGAVAAVGGAGTSAGKPTSPLRKIEPLKSDVQKVRNVLATAQEQFDEAQKSYNQLINVFQKTPNLNLQALQFRELASAAETLGLVVPKPAKLIERDFNLALAKNAEELRTNAEQLKMNAAMQIKFAQEIVTANQALEERRLKLADAAFQQGVFNNSIETNRLAQQEQVTTLSKANAALAAGTITLTEYGRVLAGIPPELLNLTDKQRLLKDEFDRELKVQKDTDLLAIYRLELARASGDVRAFVDAYSQYKSIFGATAEGELALALKGAREDIKLTDARKSAYGSLSDQLKAGSISAREFREAASNLGIDEGAANRVAAIYGSAADQIVFYNQMLEKSVDRLATKFEDDLTGAILTGKNLFGSFKDFVGSVLNDIAAQIIKQQIAAPIANALGGLAKGLGASIFGGGAAGGSSSLFGSLGKLFAGFFADGGIIGAGKFGVVGENGPEFITGPARITPMDQMGGGAGGDNVNINFNISAIDTQSGAEFIMRNKPIITGVIEQAYNRRGRRGPITVG
jgi:hypothetical protein